MILTVATLTLSLVSLQPVDKPTLELYQQRFVVRTGQDSIRVPFSEIQLPPAFVMYRKNDAYAVWDERGLTARNGKWSFTTDLKELPVNAKVQARPDIQKTVEMVKSGDRSLSASAISGSKRIGNLAYFLVRWDGKDDKAWLETLVSIDLSVAKPKPKFEGVFGGLSIANKPIDDELFYQNGGLAVAVNGDDGWGIATFQASKSAFGFNKRGDSLLGYSAVDKGALFVEKTSYGTTLAGKLSDKGKRTMTFEQRGALRFADPADPSLLVLTTPQGRSLHWSQTSAEMKISDKEQFVRAGAYVIVFTSKADSPVEGRLYDPARWKLVAKWHA